MKLNIRQVIALLLALACLAGLILPVLATEVTEATTPVREPGQCGESMYWSYASGVLTVTGSGAMDDFAQGEAPWEDERLLIKKVVIGDGITYIGASAFENYDQLTSVELGNAVYEIGKAAFKSCDGLKEITFPKSFKIFGEDSFRSCALMRRMYFEGGMPKFKASCVWDTTAELIYPVNNPWPLEHIIQLEEAFQMKIEFLCADGTDPYVTEWDRHEATAPTEETEPETTEATVPPTTEETVPPTTEPVTQPTTAPTEATQPQTVPTTAAPTEQTVPPTTQAPTAPSTEAPAEPEGKDEGPDSGIGFALIMMVLSLFAVGALVFGRSRNKGKYRY